MSLTDELQALLDTWLLEKREKFDPACKEILRECGYTEEPPEVVIDILFQRAIGDLAKEEIAQALTTILRTK